MREQTPLNIGPKAINPVARTVSGPLKPQIQKPVIDQTAGEIAQALNNLIPGAEAYYKAEQTQDIEDAKVTAAAMTVQEAISFAGKSVDEQADQLKTRALKAHSAANAAIGRKIAADREYSHESISGLYDITKSAKEREAIHLAERANLLAGIPKDNPVMYAAAVEQADNYARQISSRASSVRESRLENVAREEAYDDAHEQVSNSLLTYSGSGNKFSLRESLTNLDTTQRENYAGIAGVNTQHNAGVKDAFIGFAIDHPDEAQAALNEALTIGLFKKEEASEIQDKILQQVDIKDRRESRHEDLKFNDVQDLADQLIYDSIKEGIEPGTSVTDYLNSAQGAAVIQALEKKGSELGVDISSGRFSSVIRATASTIFRDAGAGEYSLGEEMENQVKDFGADQAQFVKFLETTNLTPEQTSRAETIFNQSRRAFNTLLDVRLKGINISESDIATSQQDEYDAAISKGDIAAVNRVLGETLYIWSQPDKSYEDFIPEGQKSKIVEDLAFNSTSSLERTILGAAGVADLIELDMEDADLRKEAQSIIKKRIESIEGWGDMTIEQKKIALNDAASRRLRVSETSFDDIIKIKADLPGSSVDGLNVYNTDATRQIIDTAKQSQDQLVTNIENRISVPSLFSGRSDVGVDIVLEEVYDNVTLRYEIENLAAIYQETFYGGATTNNAVKRVLNEPLISIGVSTQELADGRIYDDLSLVFNSERGAATAGVAPEKLLPKVDGTKTTDMSYVWIADETYETDLDKALTMTKEELADSNVGKIVKRFAPEGVELDPESKPFIDYIDYLKSANEVAKRRANPKSVGPLFGEFTEGIGKNTNKR